MTNSAMQESNNPIYQAMEGYIIYLQNHLKDAPLYITDVEINSGKLSKVLPCISVSHPEISQDISTLIFLTDPSTSSRNGLDLIIKSPRTGEDQFTIDRSTGRATDIDFANAAMGNIYGNLLAYPGISDKSTEPIYITDNRNIAKTKLDNKIVINIESRGKLCFYYDRFFNGEAALIIQVPSSPTESGQVVKEMFELIASSVNN